MPNYFLYLQLHLTNKCNWRCKHCYHEQYDGNELSLQEVKKIIDGFFKFTNHFQDNCRIGLTGGEPLLRKDLLEIVNYIRKKNKKTEIILLTNGSLIDEPFLKKLKKISKDNIIFQLSIEGPEEINDKIRGEGSYKKIMKSTNLIKKNGFLTILSLVLSKINYQEFFKLIPVLIKNDIKLSLKRLIAMGEGSNIKSQILTKDELKVFYLKIINLAKRLKEDNNIILQNYLAILNCKNVLINIFNSSEFRSSHCGVIGKTACTILPNGDVYPCRTLPIKIGNIKTDSFEEVFLEYDKLLDKIFAGNQTCRKCQHFVNCDGGSPCMKYAQTQDFRDMIDPQCWVK